MIQIDRVAGYQSKCIATAALRFSQWKCTNRADRLRSPTPHPLSISRSQPTVHATTAGPWPTRREILQHFVVPNTWPLKSKRPTLNVRWIGSIKALTGIEHWTIPHRRYLSHSRNSYVHMLCTKQILCFIINCIFYLLYSINCFGLCFVFSMFYGKCLYHILCCVEHMIIHHVNLTCARVKVHLVTSCHAEAPSRAAQSSEVRGLRTVISHSFCHVHDHHNEQWSSILIIHLARVDQRRLSTTHPG